MNSAYIIFWDENEKAVRLTPDEHKKIYMNWEKAESFKLPNGMIINKKAIKIIKPPEKPKPLAITAPEGKTISPEKWKELKKKFVEKFPS